MRHLFFCILCMLGLQMHAQSYSAICVTLMNGTTQEVELDDKLTVEIKDGYLVIESPKVTVEYPRAEVRKFTYIQADPDKIDETPEDHKLSVIAKGNRILFYGLPKDADIFICDTGGRVVLQRRVSTEYAADLSQYSKGVYLVKVGDKVTKVYIK